MARVAGTPVRRPNARGPRACAFTLHRCSFNRATDASLASIGVPKRERNLEGSLRIYFNMDPERRIILMCVKVRTASAIGDGSC